MNSLLLRSGMIPRAQIIKKARKNLKRTQSVASAKKVSNPKAISKVLDRRTVKQITLSILDALGTHGKSIQSLKNGVNNLKKVANSLKVKHSGNAHFSRINRGKSKSLSKSNNLQQEKKREIKQQLKQELASQQKAMQERVDAEKVEIQKANPVPLEEKISQIKDLVASGQMKTEEAENLVMNQNLFADGQNQKQEGEQDQQLINTNPIKLDPEIDLSMLAV